MKYKHILIGTFLYAGCLWNASGQIQEKAIPFSVTENLAPITHFEDMPAIEDSDCRHKVGSSQKSTKFACPFFTDFNPDNAGQWTQTARGRVWRLAIRSKDAYSLYIKMHYSLDPGVRLYVYNPGYTQLRGAFTSRNNNTAKILSIAPVRGDMLIVEMNIPAFQLEFGEINITKVYHDFFNIYKTASREGREAVKANDCYEDVNCSNGIYWQTEKRSVCKIISDGGIGTGTLIGNTSGNGTPYVLTAYHLIPSEEVAAETIFLFNYETIDCDGALMNESQSLSGATLLSTTDHRVDFALLQLNERPPPSYQPFYAGWDATHVNAETGVCIHHPFGGAKQIAIEYHRLTSEDIGEGFDKNSTWKVSHWELGTTESGSSGAPIFDEQHRMVGTLTGGRSTCGYSQDDFFTKFSVAWNAYDQPSNQLAYWLDPEKTGKLKMDGYDPYGFNTEFCHPAWNFSNDETLGVSNEGLSWGWISGHSSAGYSQFAERFESTGSLQINGMYLHVAKAYASNPLANIEVKVWDGNQYPEKECYSKLLFLKDLQPKEINYIAFDSSLMKSGTFFIGYKLNYTIVSDTFSVYHVSDRGDAKPSSMYIYNGSWYQSGELEAFGMATSLGIGISACYGKPRAPSSSNLNVYPNPATTYIHLVLPDGNVIQEIACFDTNGRPMPVSLSQTETYNKLNFDLRPGIYYLRIVTKNRRFVARFVVL